MHLEARSFAFVILPGLLLILSRRMGGFFVDPTLAIATPSPTSPGLTDLPQAGNTNGIAFLGILIFVVILLAVLLHLRDMADASTGQSNS